MFKFFKKSKNQLDKTSETKDSSVTPSLMLADQIKTTLPQGMILPEPLERLFKWIEENDFVQERDGDKTGWLFDIKSREALCAPIIGFTAEGAKVHKHWFGHNEKELHERLYVFCLTGEEGSRGAFWLDDEGNQKIVHMGGGSGSIMTCALTDNAIDFLRLLAIGYDEICWGGYGSPPSGETPLNTKFRDWVETEFEVSIPEKGDEIVPETAEMTDAETSSDPFLKWVTEMLAKGPYT